MRWVRTGEGERGRSSFVGVRAMADHLPFVSVDYILSEQGIDLEVSTPLAEADHLWGLGVFEFRLAFPVRRA